MAIETYVDHARTRVAAEREATVAKRDAIETFRERLEEVGPQPGTTPGRASTDGGITRLPGTTAGDGCRAVREAFAETIEPHSDVDEDEPLLEAILTELTTSIAAAVAPNSAASVTPALLQAIDVESRRRRQETELMLDVLDREDAALADAASVVGEIIDWIVTADETPLSELGFDALAARHERLATHRRRCDALAAERQSFVGDVTSADGELALRHRNLVSHLYTDFPVDHPVLSTVARLDETCADCQRAVRNHLVRRV